MTRETKVGMAVACSFLSLVVAVVVLRMRHGGEPDAPTAGAVLAQGQNGTTPSTVITPTAGNPAANKEPGVLRAVFNQSGDSLPAAEPPVGPAPDRGLPPPAVPTAAAKDVMAGVAALPGTGLPEVSPPPVPAARPLETPVPSPAPPAAPLPGAGLTAAATASPAPVVPAPVPAPSAELNKLPGFPAAEASPPPVKPKESVKPPAIAAAPADSGLPGLPPAPAGSATPPGPPASVAQNNKLTPEEEQQKKLKELMNQVAAAGPTDVPPAPAARPAPTIPVSAPKSGAEKGPLAQGNDGLPPPPAGLPAPPAPAPLPGSAATPRVEPPPPLAEQGLPPAPAPGVAKEPGPAAPPAPKAPDVTLNGQLAPMDAPPSGTGRLPGTARPGDAPTAVAMGPLGANDPSGSRPAVGLPPPPPPARAPENSPAPLPPLGAPPTGSSAPIAVPVPPPQPAGGGPAKLLSFDVETQRVNPGDTTFADLSKRIYGSDRYAQALLEFNRQYPMAGDNLKADPPRLVPGQPIFVPPTHILEQPRYASAPPPARPIASTPNPIAVSGPPPGATPVVPPRLPVAPAVPAVGSSGLAPAATGAAGTRTYTVQGNGEMLFEIARQTLGDGRRWSEIYRLNPEIRPELAIPGGTQLRLPAEARVGS